MQHAKLLALEKEFFPIRPFNCDCKCSYLSEDIMNLAMLIFDFPNVLLNFASDQEPYILVDFLFNLARTAAKLMLQYSQKFGGNNTDEKRDVCELFFLCANHTRKWSLDPWSTTLSPFLFICEGEMNDRLHK